MEFHGNVKFDIHYNQHQQVYILYFIVLTQYSLA